MTALRLVSLLVFAFGTLAFIALLVQWLREPARERDRGYGGLPRVQHLVSLEPPVSLRRRSGRPYLPMGMLLEIIGLTLRG